MKSIPFICIFFCYMLPSVSWATTGQIEGGWSFVWSAYGISWAALVAYMVHLYRQGGI